MHYSLNKIAASVVASLALLGSFSAAAQTVPATATIQWTLPTVSVDGVPLTGPLALTGVELYVSTSPIPDDSTMAPTLTLGAVQTTNYSTTVPNGSTLYVRVKAVRGAEKSAFSTQASKLIQVNTTPGVPTNVTITLNVQVN